MNMTHLLAPYTSLEELDARAERLAVAAGAERVVFGESVEGRPRVLVCANVHGVEFIAAEVALGVLGALTWPAHPVRRAAEVWVVPTLNPDAYAATWRGKGRGSVKACRTNARGVDLNRNFPLPGKQPLWSRPFAGWATGSEDPGHTCYRGPKPLSEPETQAMDRLMQRGFVASANLHSSWGTLFPAHVDDAVSFHHYRKLCQAFRQAQGHRRYMALSSRRLDWFTGETVSYTHLTLPTICSV